jgi:hypothetical protein
MLLAALLAMTSLPAGATSVQAETSDRTAEKVQRPDTNEAPTRQEDFAFRLQRTTDGRGGPDYTVTVLGDRSVTFVAHDRSSRTPDCCNLVKKKTLSINDYSMLVKQVEAMQFFKLDNIYSSPVLDARGVRITVLGPDDVHTVLRYAVPCETEYRKFEEKSLMVERQKVVAKKESRTSKKRAIDYDDAFKGITPAPDSLCKLELMIDYMTNADKWEQQNLSAPFKN